jgi:hypothetical protein
VTQESKGRTRFKRNFGGGFIKYRFRVKKICFLDFIALFLDIEFMGSL